MSSGEGVTTRLIRQRGEDFEMCFNSVTADCEHKRLHTMTVHLLTPSVNKEVFWKNVLSELEEVSQKCNRFSHDYRLPSMLFKCRIR